MNKDGVKMNDCNSVIIYVEEFNKKENNLFKENNMNKFSWFLVMASSISFFVVILIVLFADILYGIPYNTDFVLKISILAYGCITIYSIYKFFK